jgi:anti-sigma regulatory factor (Ser/Thr protein kinase)
LRLHATLPSMAVLRNSLREWLLSLGLPPGDIFDVVLACSEALTLAVEERPRQVALVIEVTAALQDDQLVVRTRDYGLWSEAHAFAQEEPLGLSLIRALMDSVELERHPDGQTVTLAKFVRSLDGRAGAILP